MKTCDFVDIDRGPRLAPLKMAVEKHEIGEEAFQLKAKKDKKKWETGKKWCEEQLKTYTKQEVSDMCEKKMHEADNIIEQNEINGTDYPHDSRWMWETLGWRALK